MNDQNLVEKLYRATKRVRRAEEVIAEIYPSDKIKSPVHLAIGHEASTVAICDNLRQDDVVFGYYRSHGLYLAKGGDMNAMMAELFGKVDGCARGKGGSMHLVDMSHGITSTSAIIASSIPNAVGYALAMKQQGLDSVVVSFFGDGATEEGVVAESLNFAALKKLPILFVCENNGLAIHTKQEQRQALPDISGRARAAGVKTTTIDEYDIFAIHAAANVIISDLRAGNGPHFIEVFTSRWLEHVGPNEDFNLGYRTRDEVDPWRESDEIARLGNLLDIETKEKIDAAIEQEITSAVEFAEQSEFPPAEELYYHVFK